MVDITSGVSDTLQILWKKRDLALIYERKHNMEPRSSQQYRKAQEKIDSYFLPKNKKAQRKKPKKKYIPEEDWG
jgi:hypothetical protein